MRQDHASFVYGAYAAGFYFTPILGGAIADLYLGRRAAVVLVLSCLLAAAAAAAAGPHGRAPWPWLAVLITVMMAGELFILPVGLGLFGRLAPKGLQATTIAAWFGAGFLGNPWAGWLGGWWARLPHAGFFRVVAAVSLVAAGLLALVMGPARRVERAV